MPNDNHRDQPDVSLFASVGFNGTAYVLCQADRIGPCYVNPAVSVELVGGTSAAAPAFAGIMALVDQKRSSSNNPAPRLGNANNVLYALAKKSGASCPSSAVEAASCVFNDVTRGNSVLPTGARGVPTNSVPCQGGSIADCSNVVAGGNGVLVDPAHTSVEAWTATPGYDMTTGLGSVNVNNLVTAWGTASGIGTTTTLSLSPTTGIRHGPSENVAVNVKVTANTGTGIPGGDVSLIASFAGPPATTQGLDHFTLSSTGGVTNATTQSLPGGTYDVIAHYAGDGTNAPSDSAAVQVTVASENSQTFIVIPTFDSTGNLVNGSANAASYGSNYIIRTYVTNSSATPNPSGPPAPLCAQVNLLTCPTGTITLTGNGVAVDAGTFPLNSAGYTRDLAPALTGGSYSLVAKYSGDNSYNASSATVPFTVTPASTTVIGSPANSNPLAGSPFLVFVYGESPALRGAAPTGTVAFFDGATQLAGPISVFGGCGGCQPAFQANANLTIATAGSHTITVQYSGDANYAACTGSFTVQLLNPTSASIAVSPATMMYGNPVTITATINTTVSASNTALKPTGNVGLFASYDGPISNPSITQIADGSGNWEIQVTATMTPQSSESISISYTGDSNYGGSFSSSFITVNIPDFSLTPVNGLSLLPVVGQAASGQITITPAGSLPSTVNLSLVAPVISGYTITLNPQQVSLNGAPALATISFSPVSSASASVILNQEHYSGSSNFQANKYWTISLASGLASCFLFLSPSGRKRKGAVCGLGLVCLLTLALGCGGGSGATPSSGGSGGGAGGGGGAASPVPTSIALSTSNAKVPQYQPFMVTATVTSSKPLTGNVNFYNFGAPIAGFPIVNGQVQVGGPGYINNPGLYQITATYSGDVNNQSSTSSALTQVITGTMPGTLQARTGSDVHFLQVNFGIQ